jgi:hypothetical protein
VPGQRIGPYGDPAHVHRTDPATRLDRAERRGDEGAKQFHQRDQEVSGKGRGHLTAPQLLSATAFVVTPRPERYIKQLVSHFGNKVKTELTEDGGRLQFDFGVCDLKAGPTGIELIGTAEDAAQLETLKDVVARHLVRFGANDELTVSWTS